LFVLAAMFVAVILAIGAVLGWRTWSRTAELERRLKHLESDLHALRRAGAPPAAAAPEVAPAPPTPAPPISRPPLPTAAPRVEDPLPPPPAPPSRPKPPEVVEIPLAVLDQPPARSTPPPLPAAKFEWERWLGVRGAAVLGGVFLIVAGFLFLQYSIERNWVTPEVRLLAGAITGVTCLVVAHFLRKRQYIVLSNSLSGAGVVLLYAVSWAAHRLYGVIEFPAAFAAMVAVTVLCAALSYRHASQLIAVLGLLGGFATPLVLSTGADHPLGLFGYALLLEFGFLFVAQRHRWPAIGMLALAGSFLIQGIWFVLRMGEHELSIGIGALLIFGLLFAIFSGLQPAAERRRWFPAQIAALIFPFCFAIYFAQRVDFGFHLVPLALLAGVMTIAGGVLARLQKTPALSLGTAAGALAMVLVWTVDNAQDLANERALELVICALSLAAIQLAFAEWEQRKAPAERSAATAAAVTCIGLLLACGWACPQAPGVPLSTWTAALVLFPLALLRLHSRGVHAVAALLGALASGGSYAAWSDATSSASSHPGTLGLALLLLAIGVTFLSAARIVRKEFRRSAFFASAAFFPMALLAICQRPPPGEDATAAFAAAALCLGLSMSLAANGARSSLLLLAAVLSTLFADIGGARMNPESLARSAEWTKLIASLAAAGAAFTLWPFCAPKEMAARAGVWRVAAISSIPWFILLQILWIERQAGKFGSLVALGSALFVGVSAIVLWKRGEPEQDAGVRARETDAARAAIVRTQSISRAWFGAVALLYASLALPLHLDSRAEFSADDHTLGVAAALYAFALAAWWRMSDHRALKYLAAAMSFLALGNLLRSAIGDEHASAARLVFNLRAYWLLLPAVAALAGAMLLGKRETLRLRGFELGLLRRGFAPATAIVATCGVLLAFAWLNLEVADAFNLESTFSWTLRGDPEANLAQSIAWALFALTLLILGVSRSLGALRWASLFLFLATIAKVFLLDLAHLGGLYRVASILGLALSLLLVSFLYQRFVFRPVKRAE
jgi:hypothetical protein